MAKEIKSAPKQYSLGKLIVFALLGFFLYSLFSADKTNTSNTSTQIENSTKTKIQKHFVSDKEPKAKDAIWTADKIFKVGVLNDGTNRNGYASYVCETMYEYGLKGAKIWVQIIDIAILNKSGKWKKLGEAHCI